jgi:hypothetical protein
MRRAQSGSGNTRRLPILQTLVLLETMLATATIDTPIKEAA